MKLKLLAALAALAATLPFAQAQVNTGAEAPDFTLTDINGTSHKLSDFRGKTVILEWINHGCPFVVKHYQEGHMQALQRETTEAGAVWLSICSSAPGKQGHYSAEDWKKVNAEKNGAATAILMDEDGKVGMQYGAKTTPHMYIIDAEGKLVYQGAIDSKKSTSTADIADSENYVRSALADLAAGRPVATAQTTPYGCSVKYP